MLSTPLQPGIGEGAQLFVRGVRRVTGQPGDGRRSEQRQKDGVHTLAQ